MFRDPSAIKNVHRTALADRALRDRDAIAIGELYRKANRSLIDSVRYQIECGQRLASKKEQLGHGSWLAWLKANADVLGFETRQTAATLMRAAKCNVDVTFDNLTVAQARQISRQLWHNHITLGWPNTGNDEWFTETKYLQLARTVLGGIDLDPASHPVAQRCVRAKKFFTKADDGLAHEWRGTVWLNPPFSRPLITQFTDKLLEEYSAGRTTAALLLTNAFTSTRWFQKAGRAASAICFSNGRRLRFVDANGKEASPTQGQAFFYFGQRLQLFARTFSDIGFIVRPSAISSGARRE
jgi:ParB family chromosome partitioning protein